ncbi:MAG: electron transfer flavoprotein subunit alpha/FixB family protein [Dehalococcoidales bacterium]|jgi:electron transfer flavoprotein alpha subunit
MVLVEYKGVMIFAEVTDGKPAPITGELLGAGRRLAGELGEELSVIIAGSEIAKIAAELAISGADKIYAIDDPLLQDYLTDSFTAVVEKVCRIANPRILLMGHTTIGRDLAPAAAFRMGTAAATDCIALDIDDMNQQLLMTKPIYGGNARAVYTMETFPQIATVRAKAMNAITPDSSRKGKIMNIPAGINQNTIRTKVIEKVVEEEKGVKLEEAAVIVTGGRGIGGAEGFKQLEELAKLLKGAVGASRTACDNGWVKDTMQIGLTGKIVAPEVYIAVAVSGTTQHLAGCSGARNIIAINKDPDANIFNEARYGVVGDWKKVVPAFEKKAKEILGK